MRLSRLVMCLVPPALACGFVLCSTGVVKAGPPEWLSDVAIHPSDPSVIALRYENALGGMMFSTDGGKTFRVRPALTFTKYGLRENVPLLLTKDGSVVLGTTEGLLRTTAQGCDPKNESGGESWIGGLALHPKDPAVAFFVTGDGFGTQRAGLWRRDAAGAASPLGANDSASLSVTGLLAVAHATATEQVRLVESAARVGGAAGSPMTTWVLRYSDDLGATWTEKVVPGTGTARLLAVDPQDPKRMVVTFAVGGSPDQPDPVLLTVNGGDSFKPYIEGVMKVGQVSVAADGRLWIADLGAGSGTGGLWYAPRVGDAAEKVLDDSVHCVGHDATSAKLWVCKSHELGLFDMKARSFCRVFQMTDAASLVSCQGEILTQSPEAKEQLCGGYCGALHFASAPLCSIYNDPKALCGLGALKYDREAMWEPPPGAGTRCAGFEKAGDAGVTLADASVGGAQDAGVSSPPDAAPSGSALDAAVGTSSRGGDDGCSVSAFHRANALSWMSLLGMMTAFVLRRRSTHSR